MSWEAGFNGRLDTVELIDIDSGTEPKEMKKFPNKIYGAVGTTLGECLIVRGCHLSGNKLITALWIFINAMC